ncbi:MAG: TIGR04551 family protein [Deltaproteobacteria bacterium]|nr:TIGR04551 family protein [Deltaproteobacteria bacterium]
MNRPVLVAFLLLAFPVAAGAQPAPVPGEAAPGDEPAVKPPAEDGEKPAPPPPPVTAPADSPAPAGAPAPAAGAGNAEEPSLDDLLQEKAEGVADQWKGPGPLARPGYPWLEHHGYFRIRMEGFHRGHLGTEHLKGDGTTVVTSGFLPPLSNNAANALSVNQGGVSRRDNDWLGGANMRFRYEPTLHVAPSLAVHTQFDVLDNLVLGSSPDYNPSRPDAPLSLFSRSQAPLSSGRNALRDAISVKQVWASWDILSPSDTTSPLLTLSAGRMARHWGLGIVENDGEDLDADFGSYVDRVTLLARLWGVYFEAGFGWVSSGPTSVGVAQPFGEPRDLTDKDDCTEVTFAVFQKPMTEAERKARFQRLVVRNRPVVDWGGYLVWRRQDLDLTSASEAAYLAGTADPSVPGGGYDALTLERRGAWFLTPDAWLRIEYVPAVNKRLRFEIEVAGVFGEVDHVSRVAPEPMEIRSIGGAFESEVQLGSFSFGMDLGVASGDTAEYFGWLDKSNFLSDPTSFNRRLSSFYFNPDYRPDLMMFRHVMGTVTNAFYFKPWFQYDIFESEKDALGGRIDLEYGRALEASATPGNDPNLGVELDVRLFYEQKGVFFAGIDWAVLWPLGAFDLISSFEDAGASYTSRWSTAIRGRIGIMF